MKFRGTQKSLENSTYERKRGEAELGRGRSWAITAQSDNTMANPVGSSGANIVCQNCPVWVKIARPFCRASGSQAGPGKGVTLGEVALCNLSQP